MDVIRFAYSTKMVFRAGDPAVPVYWFRASPDALVFQGENAFASTVWETDEVWGPLGEDQTQKRVWANSQKPAVLQGQPPLLGLPEWFRDGQPDATLDTEATSFGEPEACACQDVVEDIGCGGLRGSGEAHYGFPNPYLSFNSGGYTSVCAGQNSHSLALVWNPGLGQWEGTIPQISGFPLDFTMQLRTLHQAVVPCTLNWHKHPGTVAFNAVHTSTVGTRDFYGAPQVATSVPFWLPDCFFVGVFLMSFNF
jgi:hypothetical protein